jgi:hypothetical protein
MRSNCEHVVIVKMTKDKRCQFSKHGTGELNIYEPTPGTWSTIGSASTSKSTLWASDPSSTQTIPSSRKRARPCLSSISNSQSASVSLLGLGNFVTEQGVKTCRALNSFWETLVEATDADYLFPRRNRDSSLHWMVLKRPKVYPDSIDKRLVSQTSHASLSRSVSLLLYRSCSVNIRPGCQEDEPQQKGEYDTNEMTARDVDRPFESPVAARGRFCLSKGTFVVTSLTPLFFSSHTAASDRV